MLDKIKTIMDKVKVLLEKYPHLSRDNGAGILEIIDDGQHTGMGWMSDNFGDSEDVISSPGIKDAFKVNEFKDGYKVSLDMEHFYKYSNNDNNFNTLFEKLDGL